MCTIAIASKEQGSERDERGNELRAITELDAYTPATVVAAAAAMRNLKTS